MYNSDFNDIEIDSDVLAIMNDFSATSFGTVESLNDTKVVKPETQKITESTQKTNELCVKTNSLDSQGNILRVGDKVIVGNDKAVGRIIALGKYATVRLAGEGDFEFPCSIITLAKTENNMNVITNSDNLYESNNSRQNKNINDKFSYYTTESLMEIQEQCDKLDDIEESLQRLEEMNDGQSFNMGIK